MHTSSRFITTSAAVIAAVLALASPASAGIWTPVSSGTTGDITAVDYVGGGNLWYGTAGGQILQNGSQKQAATGFSITDLAFNPSGSVGLATATNGRLYRWNGTTWSLVSLANTTFTHTSSPCSGNGGSATRNAAPGQNLNAVTWGDDLTAYVVGQDLGVVLKTVNGGVSWTDVSRHADGTCYVGNTSSIFTDADAVNSNLVYFLDDSFGGRWITSNGVTSSTARNGSTAVNCFNKRPRIAVDKDNPNRSFVVDRCNGDLQLGYSEDGGNNYEISPTYVNGDGSSLTGLNGIAVAGGSALAVGNGGAILVDNDGRTVYFQRADGTDQTNDWLAVDKLDAANALVGGKSGRLLTSNQANAIPDVVKPAGTISGPTTVTAGTPYTYTANVSDNAGGSGVDGGSFAWSATGIPNAGGNPVSITFPSSGSYTLKVAFKDLAGNASEATLSVRVDAPPVTTATKPPTATTAVKTATVAGGTISLRTPKSCVPAGTSFTATLSFTKSRKKGTKFVKVTKVEFFIDGKRVKIDKRVPFKQTLTVKSLKAGTTHKLRARAFIKVTRGAGPKKSISTTFSVCS